MCVTGHFCVEKITNFVLKRNQIYKENFFSSSLKRFPRLCVRRSPICLWELGFLRAIVRTPVFRWSSPKIKIKYSEIIN